MDSENVSKESAPVVSRRKYPGLFLVFLAGCAAGTATGAYGGFRHGMAFILNECLSRDAREVGSRITILRHLRAGEQDQAVEKIEVGLNDILIGFDPDQPYANLKGQTVVALRNAIEQAEKYRSVYPRPANQRDFRDEMVQNLFSREPYK